MDSVSSEHRVGGSRRSPQEAGSKQERVRGGKGWNTHPIACITWDGIGETRRRCQKNSNKRERPHCFFFSCLFGSLFSYLFNDESFPLKPLLAWLMQIQSCLPGKREAVQAIGTEARRPCRARASWCSSGGQQLSACCR